MDIFTERFVSAVQQLVAAVRRAHGGERGGRERGHGRRRVGHAAPAAVRALPLHQPLARRRAAPVLVRAGAAV